MSTRPTLPADASPEAWRGYWDSSGQPWRREAEISSRRKVELGDCHEHGDFQGQPLSRADVEWLLHALPGGPVDWRDPNQHERSGISLINVNLEGVDLSELPLARSRIQGQLAKANLRKAHLEGSNVAADLREADLNNAFMDKAWLAPRVHLEKANLVFASLQDANLTEAYLEGATLTGAQLQRAGLIRAHLENAVLLLTHLEGTILAEASLAGACFEGAFMSHETSLRSAKISDEAGHGPWLADVSWNSVNLSVLDWSRVPVLREEVVATAGQIAAGPRFDVRTAKNDSERCEAHAAAARANRQFATALQDQGLNNIARNYAYRARVQERKALPHGERLARLASFWLDAVAGYGYRPLRCVMWYVATIVAFAIGYSVIGHEQWPSVVFTSMYAFHGRKAGHTRSEPSNRWLDWSSRSPS